MTDKVICDFLTALGFENDRRRADVTIARAAAAGEGSGTRDASLVAEVQPTDAEAREYARTAALDGFTILLTIDADAPLWEDDGA